MQPSKLACGCVLTYYVRSDCVFLRGTNELMLERNLCLSARTSPNIHIDHTSPPQSIASQTDFNLSLNLPFQTHPFKATHTASVMDPLTRHTTLLLHLITLPFTLALRAGVALAFIMRPEHVALFGEVIVGAAEVVTGWTLRRLGPWQRCFPFRALMSVIDEP